MFSSFQSKMVYVFWQRIKILKVSDCMTKGLRLLPKECFECFKVLIIDEVLILIWLDFICTVYKFYNIFTFSKCDPKTQRVLIHSCVLILLRPFSHFPCIYEFSESSAPEGHGYSIKDNEILERCSDIQKSQLH